MPKNHESANNVCPPSILRARQDAQRLTAYLASLGHDLPLGSAQEAIAHLHRFSNWNAFTAYEKDGISKRSAALGQELFDATERLAQLCVDACAESGAPILAIPGDRHLVLKMIEPAPNLQSIIVWGHNRQSGAPMCCLVRNDEVEIIESEFIQNMMPD